MSENLGASKLGDRFGVKGYPAVFLDDVLVASPREFGYFGEVDGAGRHAPWKSAESQARYKDDLTRMVDLMLAGKKGKVRRDSSSDASTAPVGVATLPAFELLDLSGRAITAAELADRVVLVEFWATWCPPCRSTLGWLGRLKRAHGDRVSVIALAVESPESEVRAAATDPGLRWAIADAATVAAFGDITAVPTLFLFDGQGRIARVSYGAPPDLHAHVERSIEAILREDSERSRR